MKETKKSPEDRARELDEREAALEAREKQVEDTVKKKGWRDSLYSRINIPVKYMDWIIGGIVFLLILSIIIGILL